MSVFLANESGVPVDESGLVALARFVLDTMRVPPLAELSVLCVDLDAMTSMHGQYMDDPTPTDVLAFTQDDVLDGGFETGPDAEVESPEALLGDVVICPAYATDGAKRAGHPLAAELELLLTHGILHLLGFDHAEPEEHTQMFERQAELLTRWAGARATL